MRVVKLYERDGTFVKDLPATNVTVEVDRQRAVRRSASFRVPGSSLADVKVLGRRVRIYDGSAQLFGGFIDSPQVSVDSSGATIIVPCRDKAKTFKLARFSQDTTYEDLSAAETANLVTAATASSSMAVGGQIQQYATVYRRDYSATVLGVSKPVEATESGDLRDGTYQADYSETGLTEFRVQPYIDLRATESVQAATVDPHNPADPTFSRASVAYLDDGTQIPSGAPRYQAGAPGFGQAVMVEEGTTNLLTANQASVETDTTGFGSSGATISRDTTKAWHGAASLKVVTAGAVITEWAGVNFAGAVSTTYTISVWVWAPQGASMELNATDNIDLFLGNTKFTGTGAWQRVTLKVTTDALHGSFLFYVATADTPQAITFWLDGLQIEQKAYATLWQLPSDGARAAESLTIPTAGVLNPAEGEISFLVYVDPVVHSAAANWNMAFSVADATTYNQIRFGKYTGSTNWHADFKDSAGTFWLPTFALASGWRRITVTWNKATTTAKVYVDGAVVASNTAAPLPSAFASTAYIGSWALGGYQLNSPIDDLRISSRARTDAEILAAYQSGQPLPIDPDTTYKLSFDNTLTNAAAATVSDMQVSTDGVVWTAYAAGTWRYLRFIAKSPGSTIQLGLTVTTNAAYPASNVINDDAASWRPTTSDLTRYIDLDFGSAQTVNALYLRWGVNSQDRTTRYVYKVEGSTDKAAWTTLVASAGATASRLVEHVLTSGSYRYLRITLLQVSGPIALRFAKAQNISSTTSIHSLIQQIAQSEGETLFRLTTTRQYAKATTFEAGEEKWAAMMELAASIGWELFYSADEYLTLQPKDDLDVTDPAIPTYKALFSFDAEYSDAEIYNQVIGVYESATATYRSVQEDNNAFSATGIPHLGRRTAPIQKNPLADSQQKLDAWTIDLLGRWTRQTTQVSFSISAVPTHEAGDVIRLVEAQTGTNGYFTLESFDLTDDPDQGTYDLNARVVQEVV